MKTVSRAALALITTTIATAVFATSVALAETTTKPINVAIIIDAEHPGTKIDRHIYGQFAEHLGLGIYEGIWVGEHSKIPNTRGFRNDVIAALKNIHVPVVRWPGGCFADEYHWREGIGPRAQRPVKVNTNWGSVEEPNAVGTHEFMDFAELIGADAYISGNLDSGTSQEMAEWVEYMTSDTKSTIAQLRRKNGRDKPWRLPYFGVGNENWGCGGNMRAEFYADQYQRFASFIKAPTNNTPLRVAGGPHDEDYKWTEALMSQAVKNLDAVSLHYYTFPGTTWSDKGTSTNFNEASWALTLQKTLRMDEFLTKHSVVMDKYDPKKRVGLFPDEWGTWYNPEPGRNAAFLWQQNTLRDAIVTALNFDIFQRHADRVRMANIAQMVNVLQAMILTDKDKMILTPTYHVFAMYVPFQDATALPVEFIAPQYQQGDVILPMIDVSAARDVQGQLHIALVNLDPNNAVTVTANIKGLVKGPTAHTVSGQLLTAATMDAHNTFDKPNNLAPVAYTGTIKDDQVLLTIPAKSVVVVTVK